MIVTDNLTKDTKGSGLFDWVWDGESNSLTATCSHCGFKVAKRLQIYDLPRRNPRVNQRGLIHRDSLRPRVCLTLNLPSIIQSVIILLPLWVAGICWNADRVLRGGSCNNSARNCRATNRNRRRPENCNRNQGFRVGLFPNPKPSEGLSIIL